MEENKLKGYLWNVANEYRAITHAGNIIPALIRFIFIKYVIDNYLFANDVEVMKLYATAQKYLSGRSDDAAEGFVNAVSPILENIDVNLDVGGSLARASSLYYDDLLGKYNKKKSFYSSPAVAILEMFSSFDFQDIDREKLYDCLSSLIHDQAQRTGRYGGEYITSDSLNKLAKSLLCVSDKEVVRDFACGYGLSGLSVTNGTNAKLILSDISEENIQIAIMLNVIAGKYDTKYELGNSLYRTDNEKLADVIYTDFPLNLKLFDEDREIYHTNSGNIAAIYRTLEMLKPNGRAVITCPGNVLFGNSRDAKSLRMDLLVSGSLKAVITLPTLMYGTTVNVNVLVLSKTDNKKITFINASTNDVFQFSNKARGADVELTDEGIAKIASIVNEKQDIPGISKNVASYLMASGKSLVPVTYIENVERDKSLSSKEITEQLEDLYKELTKL